MSFAKSSRTVLAAAMIIASALGTAGAATASIMSGAAAPAATTAMAPQDTPWGVNPS
jgi:hypothetical protein